MTQGTTEQAAGGSTRRALVLVARVTGWSFVPIYIVGTCAYYLLLYGAGLSSEAAVLDNVQGVMLSTGFGAFAVVGALLVVRRPTNAIGWIMGAIGLMVSTFGAGGGYAAYVMVTRNRPDALAVFGAWAANCYWYLMLALALIYLPMLFPDGRLLSRRWLLIAVIAGIATLGIILPKALAVTLPVPGVSGLRIANPIGVEDLDKLANVPISGAFEGLFFVAAVGAVSSVVASFRRSRGVERQQIKWFAYVIVVFVGGSVVTGGAFDVTGVGWLGGSSFVLSLVGITCLPIAVGIAILRHGLYEIDIIINRTLVYGSLTLMLLLVYFGGVTTTQAIFRTLTGQQQQPQLAVVFSTLAIAALFNPLRRRIQSFIDRRFFRSKYDAKKTLGAFSARLRDETDLDSLNAELVSVVRETLQPEHVSLWLLPGMPRNGAREE